MGKLDNQVIVVTGAGSGMGKATARQLAAAGARVVLVGLATDPLEEVVRGIVEAGGLALAQAVDVTDGPAVEALVAGVVADLGRIDALVNIAGANCRVMNPLYLSDADLQFVLDVNLVAVFRLARLVLPAMLERGQGTILTVSSLAADNPNLLGGAAYGAAKAGVRNFMSFLHNTFRGDGIRAITILPGEADTPILDKRPRPPAPSERVNMLQPDDVAEAIVMALSLPPRACAQEIVVCPTRTRDTSGDIALSRHIGAPANERN